MASAGLTRTAFYRYFPDLESVLLRLSKRSPTKSPPHHALVSSRSRRRPRRAHRRRSRPRADVRTHGRLLAAFVDAAATATDVDKRGWRVVNGCSSTTTSPGSSGLCAAEALHTSTIPTETARALVWMTERYLLETYGRGGECPRRWPSKPSLRSGIAPLFSRPATREAWAATGGLSRPRHVMTSGEGRRTKC